MRELSREEIARLLHARSLGRPMPEALTIMQGDALAMLSKMPAESAQCCVTSPPYWGLRDYGVLGQMGQEETPEEFIAGMVAVFSEVRRVLKPNGTLWLNIGDSYCGAAGGFQGATGQRASRTHTARVRSKLCDGMKAKDLVGIPWMLAFALRADGWFLRQDIIWHKPNPMPESTLDRCTKSHEYIFLLSKSSSYFYDNEAIREKASDGTHPRLAGNKPAGWASGPGSHHPIDHNQTGQHRKTAAGTKNNASFNAAMAVMPETRNKRSVWTVPSAPFKEAHFATYPPDLIKPCILAGSRPGDVVLDPFGGSGTTGSVALELGRRAVLIELNPDYVAIIRRRTSVTPGLAL